MIDKIIEGFKNAATNLEELQLQFALGKAEAKDKFEELKKKANQFIHETENKLDDAKEVYVDFKSKLEGLRVQLALGKAETIDAFNAQRKNINQKLKEIEDYINEHPQLAAVLDFIQNEIERIKLELEIIAVNFKIAHLKTKDSIEQRRREMDEILKNLRDGLNKHKEAAEPNKREHFRNEIKLAYHHLLQAFN